MLAYHIQGSLRDARAVVCVPTAILRTTHVTLALEPTSGQLLFTSQCACQISAPPEVFPQGGAAGTRTPDLRRARAALSQLSYGPLPYFKPCCHVLPQGGRAWTRTRDLGLIRAAL